MQRPIDPITNIHTPSRFAEFVADLDDIYTELNFSHVVGLPTLQGPGSLS